ncbi:HAAS signaling domain-containing protein [Streptomyces yaizuensis]|uniref:DUF1700 domain-containing protein n=1 Tax=Streptomyces yaizuensis TaxID=2989713 RepID=A0ABQ5P3R4_9ACTN|nr:hypothetical protein [Streptomyces sp. YSPA8]GLF97162.1 DUF1700 domain-containing protein [Streptomyces sp. YSPA8]
MKTSADAVHDYLSAVEREASALPADRRQELLADLAEHIEVTRAERPGTAVNEVLTALGDPRTIAATALAEMENGPAGDPGRGGMGAPARRGKVHPLVPILMTTLSPPAIMLLSEHPSSLLAVLVRLTGAVLLCTSVYWTALQKTVGVLLTLILPTTVFVTWNLISGHQAEPVPALLGNLGSLVLIAGTAVWLWRVRRA